MAAPTRRAQSQQDSSAQTATRKPSSSTPSQPTTTTTLADTYLILYNSLSFLLWAYILYTTSELLFLTPYPTWRSANAAVHSTLSRFALVTESLAALEVLHAALGLVRASPLTTALQVAGRNTVLWAIARNYPDVMEWEVGVGYASLLMAWAAAEVVRYSYFVVVLLGKVQGGEERGVKVPDWLVWVR